MVPQTYPSVYNTYTNRTEMVVYELTSISGKVRWTDYIPVKLTNSTNAAKDNTTDSDGCIPISPLGSITNKQAFTDYIPIYVDNSATDAWVVSATGYIPYGISSAAIGILKRFGSDAHVYLPGIGTLSGLQTANYLDSALTTPATVDNPVGGVVDAVGVINATQPTTAAKPRLERGVRNLLTYSATPTNAIWIKNAGAFASGNVVSGASGSSWGGTNIITNSVASLAASTPYTAAILVKSSGATTITLWLRDQSTGQVTSSTLALTSTSQMVAASRTSGAATTSMAIMIGAADGDVYLESAGLFQGTLTAAQILNEGGIPLTTTAAASNPSAGKYSWAFDGNDSLALGSVPFQMSDDHCTILAGKMDSLSLTRILYSQRNTGSTFPSVGQIQVATDGSINAFYRNGENTATTTVSSASGVITAGTPFVLSETKTGLTSVIRVNGVVVATASGTLPNIGTFVINAAAISGSAENGTLPAVGSLGLIVPIKGTLSSSETLTLERLVASNFPNAPVF